MDTTDFAKVAINCGINTESTATSDTEKLDVTLSVIGRTQAESVYYKQKMDAYNRALICALAETAGVESLSNSAKEQGKSIVQSLIKRLEDEDFKITKREKEAVAKKESKQVEKPGMYVGSFKCEGYLA